MKFSFPFVLLLLMVGIAQSQTILLGGSNGNGNFENGSTGWTLVNGDQINKWVVSNNAVLGATGNAIYISSSGTAPYIHQYDINASSYAYFYKDIAVPTGTKTFWVNFDFICSGEAISFGVQNVVKDALRIFGLSTNTQLIAGQDISGVNIDPGSGFYMQPSWKKKHVAPINVNGYQGGTIRLIFQWFNDGSGGAQPPIAIDNIEIYASCQEQNSISIIQNNSPTSATLNWNTMFGSSGYSIRYKKIEDPNTVPTYTNPINIIGSSNTSYILENLSPASTYYVELRPNGLPCTDYTIPTSFTTLTPPLNDSCSGATTLQVEPNVCTGTLGTFYASTNSPQFNTHCGITANNDVWYKFTATESKHIIQTKAVDYGSDDYAAKDIILYSGSCGNLTQVSINCPNTIFSVSQFGLVTRLVAEGLTPGTIYYIRVVTLANNPTYGFRICVFNETAAPDCPNLIYPANGDVINYGIPTTFRWNKAAGAAGYRVRVSPTLGTATDFVTNDTSIVFSGSSNANYTWNVEPYTVFDIPAICVSNTFTTCNSVASGVTISAPNGTTKCTWDSVLLVASTQTNVQWFRYNVLIPGATNDTLYTTLNGSYTARILNGLCYNDASNTITIANLITPPKPIINPTNDTTLCEGNNLAISASVNENNQWFNGSSVIPGANSQIYNTTTSGSFYVRCMSSFSGCFSYSDTITVNVNSTTTPIISASPATSFCVGDSVRLRSSAPLGNEWYRNGSLISNATDSIIFVKTSGDYKVRTVIGSCLSAFSNSVVIQAFNFPSAPTISFTGSNLICPGDSILLKSSVSGSNQWYKNGVLLPGEISNIYYAKEAGNYAVKISVNNCSSPLSAPVTLGMNTQPAKPTITLNGFVLTSSPANTYQWYLNNTPISGATSNKHIALVVGNYKVEIGDANGCKNTSDNINVITTGLNEIALTGYMITLSPNPAANDINILVTPNSSIHKEFNVMVTDVSGKLLLQKKLRDGNNKVDISKLAPGAYLLIIKNNQGVKTVKIVKAG